MTTNDDRVTVDEAVRALRENIAEHRAAWLDAAEFFVARHRADPTAIKHLHAIREFTLWADWAESMFREAYGERQEETP